MIGLGETELKPAVYRELDLLSLTQLTRLYGPPRVETTFYEGKGYWKPGDGQPLIAFADNPAAAQAAGRCAANRNRFREAVGGKSIHPAVCGWCDYPQEELLKGLDHAAYMSRFIVTEYAWWPAKDGSYSRSTPREGTYENPRWAKFFAAPIKVRRRAIRMASR